MQPARQPADLRLADYSKPLTRSPDALYFERRHSFRRRVRGRVTALVTGRDDRRIVSLSLRDQSDTGLGALSDAPIAVGRSISVFFPPHGPDGWFDLCGTVIRCTQHDDHYDVGIRLTQRLAA